MFNTKLKKQIESLEDELELTQKKNTELEDRIWKLENPPKYKVGDKISKEWIVVDCIFKEKRYRMEGIIRYYAIKKEWAYTLINIKTGETKTI